MCSQTWPVSLSQHPPRRNHQLGGPAPAGRRLRPQRLQEMVPRLQLPSAPRWAWGEERAPHRGAPLAAAA